MPRLFWSPDSGPPGGSLGLLNDAGQLPARSSALAVDPSDIVYPAPGGGLLRVPIGGGAAAPISGTANGQLWFWDHDAGLWLPTSAPGPDQVPRWNATTNTYDWTHVANPGDLEYFDNRFSPVGCWRFNGTMADFSGNGFDLQNTVPVAYAPVFPGKNGLFLPTGAVVSRPAFDALLAITGDMTFATIVQMDANTGPQAIVSFSASGETQATNILYQGAWDAFATVPRRLGWLSESGAGVDSSYSSGGSASIGFIHNVLFVGWTRQNDVIQPYLNGKPMGPPSAPLLTPNGGTSSRFFLGSAASGGAVSSIFFTAQIIDRALSPAEMLEMYNDSMGPAFGRLT